MEEAAKFASGVAGAPLNQVGDVQGCRLKRAKVITPDAGIRRVSAISVILAWIGLSLPRCLVWTRVGEIHCATGWTIEMWLSGYFFFYFFFFIVFYGIRYVSGAGARWLGDSLEIASESLQALYLPVIVLRLNWTVAMAADEPSGRGSDFGGVNDQGACERRWYCISSKAEDFYQPMVT